jgi:hypothetical protein
MGFDLNMFVRSPPISLTGFTLCNSNSQMHHLALSYPWVMDEKEAVKKKVHNYGMKYDKILEE